MHKYEEFTNENTVKDEYSLNEKNAVLPIFDRVLNHLNNNTDVITKDTDPKIEFDKTNDTAKVSGLGIDIYGLDIILDYNERIKFMEKSIKIHKEIIKWNSKQRVVKLVLIQESVAFRGTKIYLVGKMSELLELEEVKNSIKSGDGVDKFKL